MQIYNCRLVKLVLDKSVTSGTQPPNIYNLQLLGTLSVEESFVQKAINSERACF